MFCNSLQLQVLWQSRDKDFIRARSWLSPNPRAKGRCDASITQKFRWNNLMCARKTTVEYTIGNLGIWKMVQMVSLEKDFLIQGWHLRSIISVLFCCHYKCWWNNTRIKLTIGKNYFISALISVPMAKGRCDDTFLWDFAELSKKRAAETPVCVRNKISAFNLAHYRPRRTKSRKPKSDKSIDHC